jgi:hypothetical protein
LLIGDVTYLRQPLRGDLLPPSGGEEGGEITSSGSGCYHDQAPASSGGHFVLVISCLLLGTVNGSFSPVVEDVVAKRRAFHALNDAACVE